MSLIKKAFKKTPFPVQNIAISLVNTKLYILRHGGLYKYYRTYYAKWETASKAEVDAESKKRLKDFLNHAKNNSSWYKQRIKSVPNSKEQFRTLPVLEKIDIIDNLASIKTLDEKDGVVNYTGGTTGSSMKTIYTKSDMQERIALLDHFRAQHGYKLGKKTAWFSGKNLISEKDLNKGICSHYDFINKIRFYSTFHINEKNFDVYWNSINKFKPEFIVGFPSSVYELCKIAEEKNLILNHKVQVFFPTAETVTSQHREVIARVLGCKLVNQYASSEGAPFILECSSENLHIHPLTGIFEVVDDNLQPAKDGELIVTSFTTKGTPLVRYRIGDSIRLSSEDKTCACGSNFPLVDEIQGRTTDYLVSPTNGKVNLGNLSNSTKDVSGIIKFQAIQDSIDELNVRVVANESFNINEQKKFKDALQERFGPKVNINIEKVADIPNEKSGKFRIIRNNINLDEL